MLRESDRTYTLSLHYYATKDVIDVGLLMLLPQGDVGWYCLLSFRERSGVPYAKGDKQGNIEAPFC